MTPVSPSQRPYRILVVDDEESLRITLAANLELEGFETLEAGSAEAALKVLSKHEVDLVLTDIQMPGLNGVELFRRIKKSQPELPVVMMTAFAMEDLVNAAMTEGVFTVLFKPFEVPHAIAVLRRAGRLPLVLVVGEDGQAAPTAEVLRSSGLAVELAKGPEAAVAAVQSGKVDVVVVDVGAHPKDAQRMVERLRAEDAALAIVVATGQLRPEELQQAVRERVFSYVTKPIRPPELLQAIARARGEVVRR